MNQLSHQEQKIAALVAQELTNKEIAQRLGSSPFTVRNQMKVIMRKLELKNRIQVAYLVGQRMNADLPCESFGKPIFSEEPPVRLAGLATSTQTLLELGSPGRTGCFKKDRF
jgi:DNA-binding CsgD family transcriptional regulator